MSTRAVPSTATDRQRREDVHHERRSRAFHSHRRQDDQEGGHHGISFLIIDRGEGVNSAKLKKLGWNASDTATIAYQDVFVPQENLLGNLTRASR